MLGTHILSYIFRQARPVVILPNFANGSILSRVVNIVHYSQNVMGLRN